MLKALLKHLFAGTLIVSAISLGLAFCAPLRAFAFLGMNAGATLQGALPAWTRQLGARTRRTDTHAQAIATDAAGSIIVAGYTKGDLDGNLTGGGNLDLFVTKYDSTGSKLWTRQIGLVFPKSVMANGVATDSLNNVYVAGSTNGGIDGNTLTGAQDLLLIKYNSTGTKIWTKQLGVASNNTIGNAVATDSSGNIFVAGIVTGGLDGNTLTGTQDLFVTKYDSSGSKLWTKQLGVASKSTTANGIATDSSGNVLVTGYTMGGLDGNTLTGTYDFFVTKYDSTGAKLWTRQSGVASSMTRGRAVSTDISGNVYITGDTTGGLDGNTLTGSMDFFITKYDSSGTKLWTKQLGAASKTSVSLGIQVDAFGNSVIAGQTSGGIDGNTQTGNYDLFVAQYDSTGTKIWVKQLGVALSDTIAYGVATNASGDAFVTGYTTGGLDGNTLTGSSDLFVTKYDSAANKIWTVQLGDTGPVSLQNLNAATDSSGNLYVAGTANGGVDGNTLTGTQDLFLIKYDSTGAKLWTQELGVASKATAAYGVATDPSGNIFVTGYTTGGLDGNTLTGNQDMFLVKYNSSGTKLWTKQLGAVSAYVTAYRVATDSSGNAYVAGYTNGGLDGNSLTGTYDTFVTKYDPAGTKLWTRELGTAGKYAYTRGVATDSAGGVVIAGYTNGGLDGNTLAGNNDFFIIKYNSSGTKLWTRQLGVATKTTDGFYVATDSSGNIFVTGLTDGGLDGNTLTGTQDAFVAKYDSTGTKLWTKQLGVAAKNTQGNAVGTDSFGNVYVTGPTAGGLDGNSLMGTQDFYVTKYTAAGVSQWTKQLGKSASSATGYAVTVDPSGRLYVVGTTTGGLDYSNQTSLNDIFSCQYIGN